MSLAQILGLRERISLVLHGESGKPVSLKCCR
jgi:hypothetical protein